MEKGEESDVQVDFWGPVGYVWISNIILIILEGAIIELS